MQAQNPKAQNLFERTAKTVLVGLCCNVFLAVIKIIAGIWGNSYALMADGIESTLDIFSSAVVWGGIKISSMPADENHPYGHGKAESLAAMVVALIVVLAGLGIAVKSSIGLTQPRHKPALFTLIILIIAVLIKETLFKFLFSVGKSVNSLSLKTEAWHQRLDAITSLAAFLGISTALLGGHGYESADNWAALIASGIIMYNGTVMFRDAVKEIMDHAPEPECEETIRSIAGRITGVCAIEKCRVRKSGLNLFVDIHVEVDANMPVAQAHLISHHVKDALMASNLIIADVLVHIEPAKK